LLVACAVLLPAIRAAALDRLITGKKLQLRRSSSGKQKLVFQSKVPTFAFPAVGSR